MISIIVCSVDDKMFGSFEQNITHTIGVEHEIIRINNSNNSFSICGAYNEGARRAKYEFLCFVHEDVIMQTPRWGKILCEIFRENRELGLLGVAGTMYKSYAPWGWSLIPGESVINIIQGHKYSNSPAYQVYKNPANKTLSEVVCIDGVLMFTRKSIVEEIQFDEETLHGFHGYDIDFSLSVFRKYKVAVTFDILMTHLSEGKNDHAWVSETLKLHKKWKRELPATIHLKSSDKWAGYEISAVNDLLVHMRKLNFTPWELLDMLNYNNRNRHINKFYLLRLKLSVVKQWIKTVFGGRKLASQS
ncbi:MAG TPA: glycosyltransferase [Chitinophagaceae bacterium]|nr:glycosyltransferase [Chitinophagaceae bacterium]